MNYRIMLPAREGTKNKTRQTSKPVLERMEKDRERMSEVGLTAAGGHGNLINDRAPPHSPTLSSPVPNAQCLCPAHATDPPASPLTPSPSQIVESRERYSRGDLTLSTVQSTASAPAGPAPRAPSALAHMSPQSRHLQRPHFGPARKKQVARAQRPITAPARPRRRRTRQ